MRDIKFKALFKHILTGKTLWYDIVVNYSLKNIEGYVQVSPWLQYTGLKDKEGKEIYEGDICIVNDGFVGKKRLVRYIDQKAAFMFEVLEDVEAADFRKLKGELRFISKYSHQASVDRDWETN